MNFFEEKYISFAREFVIIDDKFVGVKLDEKKSINEHIDSAIFPDNLYPSDIKYRDRDVTKADIQFAISYIWTLVHAKHMGWNISVNSEKRDTKEIIFSRENIPVYISNIGVRKILMMLGAIKTFFFPIPKMIYCFAFPDILYKFLGWRFLNDRLNYSYQKEEYISSHEKFFHTFGDSHCEEDFRKLESIKPHYIGSRLMNTFASQPNETLNLSMYDINDKDDICFCFGEIDCRRYPDKINEETVDKYMNGIINVCKKYPSINIYVYGMIPTANSSFIEKVQKKESFVGSDNGRREISRRINLYMKKQCIRHDFNFIDVYDKYSNKDGFLDEKYSSDAIHINNPLFIYDEIIKNKIKMFYINLDIRPDRNEHFLKNCRNDVTRISATNALDKSFSTDHYIKDYVQDLFPAEAKIKDCMTRYPYRSAKLGEIGCTLSHLRLYKLISELKESKLFVIFEDDVEFLYPFFPTSLPENVDIAFLGWTTNSTFESFDGKDVVVINGKEEKIIREKTFEKTTLYEPLVYFKNIQCWNSGGGSFCYMITKKGVEKIFDMIKRVGYIFWPIDYFLLAISTPSFVRELTRKDIPNEAFLNAILVRKEKRFVHSKVDVDSDIQGSRVS